MDGENFPRLHIFLPIKCNPGSGWILLTVKTFHYISGAYPLHNGFGKMISMI